MPSRHLVASQHQVSMDVILPEGFPTSLPVDNAPSCWLKGFPNFFPQLPSLNGRYWYVGEANHFPSFRLGEDPIQLQVDPRKKCWTLVLGDSAGQGDNCVLLAYHNQPLGLTSELPVGPWTMCASGVTASECCTVEVNLIHEQPDGASGPSGLFWAKGPKARLQTLSVASLCVGLPQRQRPGQLLRSPVQNAKIPPSGHTPSSLPCPPRRPWRSSPALPPSTPAGPAAPAAPPAAPQALQLPPELLVGVFAYVQGPAVVAMLSVCSAWKQACTSCLSNPSWVARFAAAFPFVNLLRTISKTEDQCEMLLDGAGDYASFVADGWHHEPTAHQMILQVLQRECACLMQAFGCVNRCSLVAMDCFGYYNRAQRVWTLYRLPELGGDVTDYNPFEVQKADTGRLRGVGSDYGAYDPYEAHRAFFLSNIRQMDFATGTHVEVQRKLNEEGPFVWWKGVIAESYRQASGVSTLVVDFPWAPDVGPYTYVVERDGSAALSHLGQEHDDWQDLKLLVGGFRLCTVHEASIVWPKWMPTNEKGMAK